MAVADIRTRTSELPKKEAILCQKFQAHNSAVSACLVLEDSELSKTLVTSSLDKSLASWSTGAGQAVGDVGFTLGARLTPPGAPVFSLAADRRSQDGLPDQVFCGNHAKQVLAWVPPKQELEANVVLDEHCGWVRSVAIAQGRWLFSCACNTLRQWDMARAIPRCVNTVTLDKGDILSLVASKDKVFAATAEGSLRVWQIGKKGELHELACRPKAHKERVTAIALRNNNWLYSVSYDGSLKAWDASSLELVMCAPAAHEGQRIHTLALGPDKVLYTGGDDQLIRRWSPALLEPAAPPLFCHNHPVRALAAGGKQLVVSGDKGGEVAVWKVA